MIERFVVETPGPGLHEITARVRAVLVDAADDLGPFDGLCTVFVRHTSASLVIQENADPSARHDLERWLARLVPEQDALYTHVAEGPDDMPSHVRSALTQTSIGIPVEGGEMLLGTWQGVYLWEHRRAPHRREVVVLLTAGAGGG